MSKYAICYLKSVITFEWDKKTTSHLFCIRPNIPSMWLLTEKLPLNFIFLRATQFQFQCK